MPHINCQLWVLFTQRGGRYNVFQCLQRIVDYARSCFNARGASPHYCLRHCLWRFNQVAAASKRGRQDKGVVGRRGVTMLPLRKLGSGWGWLEQLHFLAIKLFLNASSDQKKGIWLNEPEMLTIAHQNNSIKKIRWFDLILFKKSWACLPFGSPFFVTPLLLKSSCNLPLNDYYTWL